MINPSNLQATQEGYEPCPDKYYRFDVPIRRPSRLKSAIAVAVIALLWAILLMAFFSPILLAGGLLWR